MVDEFEADFILKIVTTEEERKELTHLTAYAFLSAPADLILSQQGFESIKYAYILSVSLKNEYSPVATATCQPMTQNVRGKVFKIGGIAAVATQPEFRRQGIIRHLITNIFHHAKETGEIFSTLYPFKESFYAKFGYISLPIIKIVTIPINSLTAISEMKLTGYVKHFYLKDVFDQYYDFTVEIQKKIHGMNVDTKGATSFINASKPSYVAFAYENEKITGCFVYTTKQFSTIDVRYFYYTNANAKYLLLEFAARHIDQFKEIILPTQPAELPELWLNDQKVMYSTRSASPLAMGRIIDINKLGGLKVGNETITMNVMDPLCPWNEGIFTFASIDGVLKVSKEEEANKKIECTITISGLSALIYGCYSIEDFPFRKWITDYSDFDEVCQRIKDLFPLKLPFMHESF